jgi:hypothetical protein
VTDPPCPLHAERAENGKRVDDVRLDGERAVRRRRCESALLEPDRLEQRRELAGEAGGVVGQARAAVQHERRLAGPLTVAGEGASCDGERVPGRHST